MAHRVVAVVMLGLAGAVGLFACSGGPGTTSTLPDPDQKDGSSADSTVDDPPSEDCSNAGCALPPTCNPDGTPGPAPKCSCGCTTGQIVNGMVCTDRGCLAPIPDAGDDAGDGGDGG